MVGDRASPPARISTAAGASGTKCGRLFLVRVPGRRITASSRSTSDQRRSAISDLRQPLRTSSRMIRPKARGDLRCCAPDRAQLLERQNALAAGLIPFRQELRRVVVAAQPAVHDRVAEQAATSAPGAVRGDRAALGGDPAQELGVNWCRLMVSANSPCTRLPVQFQVTLRVSAKLRRRLTRAPRGTQSPWRRSTSGLARLALCLGLGGGGLVGEQVPPAARGLQDLVGPGEGGPRVGVPHEPRALRVETAELGPCARRASVWRRDRPLGPGTGPRRLILPLLRTRTPKPGRSEHQANTSPFGGGSKGRDGVGVERMLACSIPRSTGSGSPAGSVRRASASWCWWRGCGRPARAAHSGSASVSSLSAGRCQTGPRCLRTRAGRVLILRAGALGAKENKRSTTNDPNGPERSTRAERSEAAVWAGFGIGGGSRRGSATCCSYIS